MNVVVDTPTLSPHLPKDIADLVDPDGVHVVEFHFPHDDAEFIRCVMLVKLRGTMTPHRELLTIPMHEFLGYKNHDEFVVDWQR